jgi:outer membrane protein insertion porin family
LKMPRAAAALVLVILTMVCPRAGQADAFRVTGVDVRGADRVSADAVRQVMKTEAGSDFDPETIREDVKAVFRMGYFTDVAVDAEPEDGGVRLTVIVKEKPLVSAVEIEGSKEVEAGDIRQALTVRERTLFQEEKVKESARKVLELYQNKGFYDVSVTSVVTETPDGAVRVAFRIAEGEKVRIRTIRIMGNRFLSDKAVRKVIETKEKGFFSFITDSGAFKRDVLENDVKRVEALYQNEGFIESKVSDPEIRRGPKGLEVTIHVIEGRQFRVGEVRFAGETDLAEDAMKETVKTVPGAVFSRETLLTDLLALTTALNDRGYAQALVSPIVEKRQEYPVADVTFKADQGRKFRFGKVTIAGNTKTLDRVIRRNIEIFDGTLYNATGLRKSRENLHRLTYFKDIKVTSAPAPAEEEIDVTVEVEEGPTGTLSGGLGFSSVDKLFGVIQLSENNLFGRGWRIGLNSQFGARRTVFSFDFRDPYFLDTDFSLLLNAYNIDTKYTDFRRKARGGRAGLGYAISRDVSTSFAVRIDRTEILEVGPTVSAILQEEFAKGSQSTRSMSWAINRNTTDRFIDPSRGTVQSLSVEYAGGPLGGDSQFVKYFLNGKVFFPVTEKTVLSGNLLWGHVISTEGGRVPIFERFFLGGPFSIRGFRSRTLAPADPATGELIGGNKELIMNIEYIFPLFNEIGFKGVLFFDAGNTWRQGEWPWDERGIRYAAGFGIRWYSPMGPLRFEWGFNLDPEPGEARKVAEFTIGTVF